MTDIYEGFEASALRTTIAELQAEVATLQDRLELQKSAMSAANRFMAKTIEDAKKHLEAYIDDNDIEIEEGTDFEALCNLLEVESTKTIDIKVTISWSVSATIPRSYDPQEWVDEQTWGAELNEDYVDLDHVHEIETRAEVY